MTTHHPQPSDVSAVICTKNSIASIQACLQSLKDSGVGEIIVVDASSTDGTRGIAESLGDLVLEDPGTGLGQARNIGIAASTKDFILNMGSDNVMPPGQLQIMLTWLDDTQAQGVSAQTHVSSQSFIGRGLSAWRKSRFRPGSSPVIGTPTLIPGNLLRNNPYDPSRRFSDDSELCARWTRDFGARFEISDAFVEEHGKATWKEVITRARMYGESDYEVFISGGIDCWPWRRRVKSLLHPLRVDLIQPLARLKLHESLVSAPFLAGFVAIRYLAWISVAVKEKLMRRYDG